MIYGITGYIIVSQIALIYIVDTFVLWITSSMVFLIGLISDFEQRSTSNDE